MIHLQKIIILILGLFMLNTCEESIEPEDEESLTISDVIHMIWILESYETEDQVMDLSSHAPFKLVYGDSVFFGDDGCNYFEGIYETNGDTIFPVDAWITLRSCDYINSFSWQHLTEPYRYKIQFENGELMIYSNDLVYTYRSNFLKDVESLLIDKEWILSSSNYSQYEETKDQQLYCTLAFDENRLFNSKVRWYTADENVLLHNEAYGVYGIGNNNGILFYHKGGGGRGSQPARFARKILSSSSYTIDDSLLILFNENDNTTFEFYLE